MKNSNIKIQSFARCMSKRVTKISDRAIAFLYFYAVKNNSGRSLKQIVSNFENAGFPSPNVTKLREAIVKDRRIAKIPKKDKWRLRSDKISEVEEELQIKDCLNGKLSNTKVLHLDYVDRKRFLALKALKKKKGKYDFSRLIQMLKELNHAYSASNYISVSFLVRSILDHVPPIFGFKTFSEVANNYKGSKSFKESMLLLEKSSRKIADSYLHTLIRETESLPTKTQVNFSNDIDVLLAEIIRISENQFLPLIFLIG